jgi:tetratricopeptide (TPR) repeat protein
VEAAANEVKLIKAPADLGKVINAAGEKLVAETQAARAREVRSKQSLSDRQAWLDTTFAKAVDLEKQGNYEGSLKLWAEMLPYLKENPEAQQAIFTLKQNYDAFVEAKNSAEEAASDLHQKPQVPGDLVLTLTEANERLKNDTAIASQRTVDARKSNEERKAYLDDTLRKARTLYEGGKVREALDTWKTALPYFEETNELKGALNAVEISLGNANDAKAARDEALAAADALLASPDANLRAAGKIIEVAALGWTSETPISYLRGTNILINKSCTCADPRSIDRTCPRYRSPDHGAVVAKRWIDSLLKQ